MTQGDIPGTTTLRWRTAAALAGALLLLGCTPAAGPEPTGEPTTAQPTPTPTPTPIATTAAFEPPEPSPEMERTDEMGAVAAAEYFMELFGYTLQSLDLDRWEEVSASSCSFCLSVAEDAARVKSEAHAISGGGVTIRGSDMRNFDEVLGGYAVEVEFRIAAGAEVDSTGAAVRTMPDAELSALVDVRRSPGGWILVGVGFPENAER